MHEEALIQDLRRALLRVVEAERGSRLVRATVRVGPLSHLHPEDLKERWGDILKGTPAEGCQLVVVSASDPTDPLAQSVVLESVQLDAQGPTEAESDAKPLPLASPRRA